MGLLDQKAAFGLAATAFVLGVGVWCLSKKEANQEKSTIQSKKKKAKKKAKSHKEDKDESSLTPIKKLVSPETPKGFKEGDVVEANWQGKGEWFRGRITSLKPLGAGKVVYGVTYEDGETETRIEAQSLRLVRRLVEKAKPQEAPQELPDLTQCVVYKKDEDSLPNRITPPLLEDTSEDDVHPSRIETTEGEWKTAVTRKPRQTKAQRDLLTTTKKETSTTLSTTEKNRKKREKQKANKIAVREAMRNKV